MERGNNHCNIPIWGIRHKINRVELRIFIYEEIFSSLKKKKRREEMRKERLVARKSENLIVWSLEFKLPRNWLQVCSPTLLVKEHTLEGVYRQNSYTMEQWWNWHTGNDFRILEMEICKRRKFWCSKPQRSDITQWYSNISLQLKFYFQISLPKNSTVHPFSVV